MKKITYVTGNTEKIKNAKHKLEAHGIEVVQATIDTPEIQSADAKEVAEYSAIFAGDKLQTAVIKMDVGFYIDVLEGFPGPFIKYVNNWLQPEKILKLMEGESDRKAYFSDVIAFYEPCGECVSFEIKTNGVIAEEPKGDNGWGIDKIFIPNGFESTLAEMTDKERLEVWKNEHWTTLAEYIKSK